MDQRNPWPGVLLRVGVFALLSIFGYFLFPSLMLLVAAPVLVVAALGTFAAAAVANALALRIYERGQLSDVGLGWTPAARRNLSLGVLGGLLAAALVVDGFGDTRRWVGANTGTKHALEQPSVSIRGAAVWRYRRRAAVSGLWLPGSGESDWTVRDYPPGQRAIWVRACGESELRLAAFSQHGVVGNFAGMGLYPQRRSLVAHRAALRLELGAAAFGRQLERVYNECYRVHDALEPRRALDRR